MRPQFAQPVLATLERVSVCDVVDDQGSKRAAVVGSGHRLVSLRPGCVPNLCLYREAVVLNLSRAEVDADGGLCGRGELILREPLQQVGLSHCRIANNDAFEEVVGFAHADGPRSGQKSLRRWC